VRALRPAESAPPDTNFYRLPFGVDLSRIPKIKSFPISPNSRGGALWDDFGSDPPAGCCSWWEWASWSIAGCSDSLPARWRAGVGRGRPL